MLATPAQAEPVKLPLASWVVLGLLALLGAAAVLSLVLFWGANPEYTDRFLILATSAVLVWLIRGDLLAHSTSAAKIGFLPLALGAVAFPAGWYLQAQISPKPVLLWLLVLAWIAMGVGVALILGGWWHLRRLAFPLVFILFALPIPNRILIPLQLNLQSATTSAAAAVLPILQIPVERSGFVLTLPGGDLGIAEACSGVRSVTALTAIAAFIGYWSGFGLMRGSILLLLSIPVIAAVNAFRVILSGLIQEHIGQQYIVGDWHEGLGVAMILIGLGLIVLLARMMQGNEPIPEPTTTDETPPGSPYARAAVWAGAAILASASIATLASQFMGKGQQIEFVATAPLDDIPMTLVKQSSRTSRKSGQWKGIDMPIDAYVSEMLTYDRALHRLYTDEEGNEADVFIIFWSSRNMVKGYHHPDICLGNQGFQRISRDILPAQVGAGQVNMTVREFARKKDARRYVLYWTQEGRRVWSEEDERMVQGVGDSHDWLGERLFQRAEPTVGGRLVVLIISRPSESSASQRAEVNRFAVLLGEALYQVCPWAAVGQ